MWNGTASHKDYSFWNKLPPTYLQELGYKAEDNETFFVKWEDTVTFFDTLFVCALQDGSNYLYEETMFSRKRGLYFEIDLLEEASITITLSQQGLNAFPIEHQDVGLARLTLVASKY